MDNFIIHMQAICGRFYLIVDGRLYEFEMGGCDDDKMESLLAFG